MEHKVHIAVSVHVLFVPTWFSRLLVNVGLRRTLKGHRGVVNRHSIEVFGGEDGNGNDAGLVPLALAVDGVRVAAGFDIDVHVDDSSCAGYAELAHEIVRLCRSVLEPSVRPQFDSDIITNPHGYFRTERESTSWGMFLGNDQLRVRSPARRGMEART